MIAFLKRAIKKVSDAIGHRVRAVSVKRAIAMLVDTLLVAAFLQSLKIKRAMSAAGAIVLLLGIVGIFIFGYLIYKGEATYGTGNSLSLMAAGVGLLISFVLFGLGLFGKMK